VIRVDFTRFLHGEIYSPIRQTSYAQYISLTEAYRKFQYLRILPQTQLYMPPEALPGMVSPARAAGALGDFRQGRIFGDYNLKFGARLGF
jgi:hypothetical protein